MDLGCQNASGVVCLLTEAFSFCRNYTSEVFVQQKLLSSVSGNETTAEANFIFGNLGASAVAEHDNAKAASVVRTATATDALAVKAYGSARKLKSEIASLHLYLMPHSSW